jgi:hypothetical protein
MALRASVGVSKKVGLPDYGSLGAHAELELELDSSLVGDVQAFHERIRKLYDLATRAVNDQLARSNGNGQNVGNEGPRSTPANGHNGDDDTPASNKQIKYLLDMARQRHSMDLARTAEFCGELVGTNDVYRLTKRQASAVIDRLTKNGNGRR